MFIVSVLNGGLCDLEPLDGLDLSSVNCKKKYEHPLDQLQQEMNQMVRYCHHLQTIAYALKKLNL